ncbi:phosphotransferase enzyme family protein [Knoellia sp. Soil729]|uniref:phosphotransferase enzyme family protein n=1 Tax=Knoellia sp. Soil729 TaxID=1736394 RepID=UPI0006FC4C0A|nr:aminoglycoside phosphotransferase family protein [Knoellia sp. Soil729]KRE41914.1 hypothetical protein ASG74_05360 [Knoellia sp. Soil729]
MDAFAEWVRSEFGLGTGTITSRVGGRGADGDVWHLSVAGRDFAVKRPFRALDAAAVRREAALLHQLAMQGVEVPTHVATSDGHLVRDVPAELGGGSARVSHWVAGTPVTDRTSEVAGELGTLVAQLHRAGPTTVEPPRDWHSTMPSAQAWAELVQRSHGQAWHGALAARLGDLTAYAEVVRRAGRPAGPFVLGHCDLHPDNVVLGPDGSLRALDWEDCGPLQPSRELAKTLVQWHVLGDDVDEGAVAVTTRAYRAAAGPGVVAGVEDFAMVLCAETNFLASQIRLALDTSALPARREQARGEVREAVADYLPTMAALARVLRAASRA